MPRRFVILFIPLYLVGVGISAEKISVKSTKISMAVYAILGIVFLSNFNNTTRLNNFYTINSLMLATKDNRGQRKSANDRRLSNLFNYLNGSTSDYLPQVGKPISKKKIKSLYKKEVVANNKNFRHKVLSNGRLKLSWKADKNKKEILPMVMYKKSKLELNNKKIVPHKDSIGVPTVHVKKGYNQAILNYQAPKWFKSILVIGCLAWVVFIFIWFRKKDKFKSVLK